MTAQASRKTEKRVDIYRITHMRDGAIYRTAFVEQRWVPLDEQAPEGLIYAAVSDHEPAMRFAK